ncbi:DgyrCDS13400 [Dimorphilus gyrociliatus]|uniref:DgyrCDS13400 n=1 Tax=Dimorphilus gyrociliatus TaxID=2664684 RepID=A0A7I8WAJ6_9ANNE|nr:DgyrCDS13400 [Dimorphilus gyrociliatus]
MEKSLKRKVEFDDKNEVIDESEPATRRFKENHTLDSDDEDKDCKNYDVLNEDDIEGQESDPETGFDGETKLTPFNMKEELEEGHFDKQGTYIFEKDKEEVKDAWMDNIDWVRVKEREKNTMEEEDNDEDDSDNELDKRKIFTGMLKIMKPGENVLQALKRLGGNSLNSASARWSKKKPKKTTEESTANKEALLELTGYADEMLTDGETEIYQYTFEKLTHCVKSLEEKMIDKPLPDPQKPVDEDLDIFGDEMSNNESKSIDTEEKKDSDDENGVMWEYKWKESDTELIGPFSSKKMLNWCESGFFKAGALCRKVGSTGGFYPTSRIDFDIYV